MFGVENYEQNLFVYFEGYLQQIADKRDIEQKASSNSFNEYPQ